VVGQLRTNGQHIQIVEDEVADITDPLLAEISPKKRISLYVASKELPPPPSRQKVVQMPPPTGQPSVPPIDVFQTTDMVAMNDFLITKKGPKTLQALPCLLRAGSGRRRVVKPNLEPLILQGENPLQISIVFTCHARVCGFAFPSEHPHRFGGSNSQVCQEVIDRSYVFDRSPVRVVKNREGKPAVLRPGDL
jgi:hypothetical protein